MDEELVPLIGGDGDAEYVVGQKSVVGHVAGEIGVRPVGAPQGRVGELFDDPAGEGHHVAVGVTLSVQGGGPGDGEPFGAGHLDPDVVALDEAQEAAELRPSGRLTDIGTAQVVHHEGVGSVPKNVSSSASSAPSK